MTKTRLPRRVRTVPGDLEFLRQSCLPVTEINQEIKNIHLEMIYWMNYHRSGIGLAANQIGFDKRIICVDPSAGNAPIVLINPVVIEQSNILEEEYEQCLSVPGASILIPRPVHLTVEYRDINFKSHTSRVTKLMARIICHEVDHLDGRLITDYEKRTYHVNSG